MLTPLWKYSFWNLESVWERCRVLGNSKGSHTSPGILSGSINMTNPLPVAPYRCFRDTQPAPSPGPCLGCPAQPRKCHPPPHVPRATSSSPTPFLCFPLQPDQTLPSYLNIHKAPAQTSEAGKSHDHSAFATLLYFLLKSMLNFILFLFVLN